MSSRGWNDARKAKQRVAIHRWRPWENSSGPKSEAGKQAVGRNAIKHGTTTAAAKAERRALRRLLATLEC
jgi:hypothetical protein